MGNQTMDTVILDTGKRKTFDATGLLHNSRDILCDKQLMTIAGCFFIAIVSIYDTYLVTIEPWILQMEKNPICTTLIKMDPHLFSYFICGKMTGTAIVVGALLYIHHIRYSHAALVTGAVVAFQALLLVYLHLSDPRIGGLPNFALLFQG